MKNESIHVRAATNRRVRRTSLESSSWGMARIGFAFVLVALGLSGSLGRAHAYQHIYIETPGGTERWDGEIQVSEESCLRSSTVDSSVLECSFVDGQDQELFGFAAVYMRGEVFDDRVEVEVQAEGGPGEVESAFGLATARATTLAEDQMRFRRTLPVASGHGWADVKVKIDRDMADGMLQVRTNHFGRLPDGANSAIDETIVHGPEQGAGRAQVIKTYRLQVYYGLLNFITFELEGLAVAGYGQAARAAGSVSICDFDFYDDLMNPLDDVWVDAASGHAYPTAGCLDGIPPGDDEDDEEDDGDEGGDDNDEDEDGDDGEVGGVACGRDADFFSLQCRLDRMMGDLLAGGDTASSHVVSLYRELDKAHRRVGVAERKCERSKEVATRSRLNRAKRNVDQFVEILDEPDSLLPELLRTDLRQGALDVRTDIDVLHGRVDAVCRGSGGTTVG